MIEALYRFFSDIEGSTNKPIHDCPFLVGKRREPQSINAKLFLPMIPIGIVAFYGTTFVERAVYKVELTSLGYNRFYLMREEDKFS